MKPYMSDLGLAKNLVLKSLSGIFFNKPLDKELVQVISRRIIRAEYLYCKNEEKKMDGFIRNGLSPLLYEYILFHCGDEGIVAVMQDVEEDNIKAAKKKQYSTDVLLKSVRKDSNSERESAAILEEIKKQPCRFAPEYFESPTFKMGVGPIEAEDDVLTRFSLTEFGERIKGLLGIRASLEFMYGTVLSKIQGEEKNEFLDFNIAVHFNNNIKGHIDEILKSQVTFLQQYLERFVRSKHGKDAAQELQLICNHVVNCPLEEQEALMELIQWQFQRMGVGVRLDQIKINRSSAEEEQSLRDLCETLVPTDEGIVRDKEYKTKIHRAISAQVRKALGERGLEYVKRSSLSKKACRLYFKILEKEELEKSMLICKVEIKQTTNRIEELERQKGAGGAAEIKELRLHHDRLSLDYKRYSILQQGGDNKGEIENLKLKENKLKLKECLLKLEQFHEAVEKATDEASFSALYLQIKRQLTHLKTIKNKNWEELAGHVEFCETRATYSVEYLEKMIDITSRIKKCSSSLEKQAPAFGGDGVAIWAASLNQQRSELRKQLEGLQGKLDAAKKAYQMQLESQLKDIGSLEDHQFYC